MNEHLLFDRFDGLIQENVSLKDKNWFQTGGCAWYFAAPSTTEQFQATIGFAIQKSVPLFMLGQGANILVSDDGFAGLVIQPKLNEIIQTTENRADIAHIVAGAGVSMATLIDWCLERNFVGLEEFSGIPSSVGGAVYINLHYFEFLLQQFLVSAKLIHAKTAQLEVVGAEWFDFRYDYSKLHTKTHYLASATFAVKHVSKIEAAYAKGRSVEIIRHRAFKYPQNNTCGCFFRNFRESEVPFEINGKKMLSAAYYLDSVGVKGSLRVGGAVVSQKHANMIVNDGTATSQQIIELALQMQEIVKKRYGLLLQPECQFLGIDKTIFGV
ncbi:UDP-N-acetylmuramate dehydrogenase [bacterium]|nr:MAG: UDP-N-acetylmuramate dehydrogenase [bacterium]QQR61578.1 MAG: UDP-N-acetylmuramate dehydrogenase [bacterium]QQR62886.1 MAG: UDP-N-acetylmuramate dehydrogenase [bacterium]